MAEPLDYHNPRTARRRHIRGFMRIPCFLLGLVALTAGGLLGWHAIQFHIGLMLVVAIVEIPFGTIFVVLSCLPDIPNNRL